MRKHVESRVQETLEVSDEDYYADLRVAQSVGRASDYVDLSESSARSHYIRHERLADLPNQDNTVTGPNPLITSLRRALDLLVN